MRPRGATLRPRTPAARPKGSYCRRRSGLPRYRSGPRRLVTGPPQRPLDLLRTSPRSSLFHVRDTRTTGRAALGGLRLIGKAVLGPRYPRTRAFVLHAVFFSLGLKSSISVRVEFRPVLDVRPIARKLL